MKKIMYAFSTVAATFGLLVTAVHAGGSMGFFDESARSNWTYFGGCEADDNTACVDYLAKQAGQIKADSFFNIGALGVKQGVFQVAGPGIEFSDGRFLFEYTYQFQTEESSSSTADTGVIKIKNINTNEIYYSKELTPADATSDWVTVRAILPVGINASYLQLVYEVVNDDQRLSTLQVNNMFAMVQQKPTISGSVNYTAAGKTFGAANASILLKNKAGDILRTVRTDSDGNYSFDKVKVGRKYTIVVKYQGETQTITTSKAGWDEDITVDDVTFE